MLIDPEEEVVYDEPDVEGDNLSLSFVLNVCDGDFEYGVAGLEVR